MAGTIGGSIKFGEVNWSDPQPKVQLATREQLIQWQSVKPLI
jgi:hypothetical protein